MRLRHVNRIRRGGLVYYYHRKTGERLPDDQEARAARVLAINAGLKPRTVAHDSLQALIIAYKASAEWHQLAPKTKYEYGRHLDALGALLGAERVDDLEPHHVLALRDTLAETPREANYRVKVLRRLLSWAVPRRLAKQNVARGLPPLKEGEGFQAWPPAVWQAFLAHPDCYPQLAWAVRLLRYSGQRPQDAVAFPWPHAEGGRIALRQIKGGRRIRLPTPQPLLELFEEVPKTNVLVLTTKDGTPWTVDYLAKEVRRVMDKLGQGGKGYTPHGLRHLAGDELAEAGATDKEIQAVLGHLTLDMVQRYTQTADRERLAGNAMDKLHRPPFERPAGMPAEAPSGAKEGRKRERILQNGTAQTAKHSRTKPVSD